VLPIQRLATQAAGMVRRVTEAPSALSALMPRQQSPVATLSRVPRAPVRGAATPPGAEPYRLMQADARLLRPAGWPLRPAGWPAAHHVPAPGYASRRSIASYAPALLASFAISDPAQRTAPAIRGAVSSISARRPRIDTRPALAPRGHDPGPSRATTTINATITVTAAPGQDPQAIGREVVRHLKKLQGKSRGGALHDGGDFDVA